MHMKLIVLSFCVITILQTMLLFSNEWLCNVKRACANHDPESDINRYCILQNRPMQGWDGPPILVEQVRTPAFNRLTPSLVDDKLTLSKAR